MTEPTPIATPSGYAPTYVVGFADPANRLALVSADSPLPVSSGGAAPTPLVGETSASTLAGPFAAAAGRTVSVTLAGTWSGTVTLQRSTDGGATRDDLRVAGEHWGVFTTSGCEQVWPESESGASYYLHIVLENGTLAYRVSQ